MTVIDRMHSLKNMSVVLNKIVDIDIEMLNFIMENVSEEIIENN